MSALAEWLLEQIAEDEAMAQAASAVYPSLADGVAYADADTVRVCLPPARVLAECKTKRAIVELHAPPAGRAGPLICTECGGYSERPDPVRGATHHGYVIPWPCSTLRMLALPYADRPGYREEWRP